MIEGCVSEDGLPTIALEIAGRSWTAIIDTGFNGDLELPTALAEHVHAQYFARGRSVLAGGQVVDEHHFRVQFAFDGALVPALATFVPGDEILIGTRLLEDYRLEIDFPARTVTLER